MSKRVLIVDDSTFLAKQIKDFMEKQMSFEVVGLGKDGNEAIALYKELKPDLVTMDLTMPNKDGQEAIKEIMEEFPDATIMVVSAVRGSAMLECMKLGAKGYVEKPLKFADPIFVEDFKKSIEEVLEF
ncbi:MAG: response regulator [Fibrobacter sp.]|nr:response regulator [Fibrobacter sp.]